MFDINKKYVLQSKVIIPAHERNAVAGAGADVYNSIVNAKHFNNLVEELKENFDNIPIETKEDFDEKTWDNIHSAELYLISKESLEEYAKLKAEKKSNI